MDGRLDIFEKNSFNITDFGATVCDELQTGEIQAALDACFLAGGGTVVIPAGIFRTGGIRLRSNTRLHLKSGAILRGSDNPLDYFSYKEDKIEPIEEYEGETRRSVYPYSRWNNAIIRVINAKNIAITGEPGAYIDGVDCYDPEGEEDYRGPHAINIQGSENIYLDGYAVTDSANWAHAIFNSRDITARHLTVYGGHDGFDVRTCDNVLIEDCEFYTGDDCIAGFDNHEVVIRRCILNCACSALRFGGNNVLVEDCHASSPARFGHRYTLTPEEQRLSLPTHPGCRHNMYNGFLYYCDHRAKIRRTPGDILIRRCRFDNPDSLFSLAFSEEHVWCRNRSLSSIKFEDCTVTGVVRPIYAVGDENEPLSFTLENVSITPREGSEGINVMESKYCSNINLRNVVLSGFTAPNVVICSNTEVTAEGGTPVSVEVTEDIDEYDC